MSCVNISTVQSHRVELTYLGRRRRRWCYSRVRRFYGWRQKQKDKKTLFGWRVDEVLSRPGHGKSRSCIAGSWTFQFHAYKSRNTVSNSGLWLGSLLAWICVSGCESQVVNTQCECDATCIMRHDAWPVTNVNVSVVCRNIYPGDIWLQIQACFYIVLWSTTCFSTLVDRCWVGLLNRMDTCFNQRLQSLTVSKNGCFI